MSNWAEGVGEDVIYEDGDEDYIFADEENELKEESVDEEELWANAKIVRDIETDADGNQFEIIKKVRQYHVDRAITPADLRASLPRFGKGATDQATLVSKEPPLALELGSVDSFERESRNEVKRLLHELSNAEVTVTDSHLQIVVKDEQLKKLADATNTAKGVSSSSGEATWGANRTNAPKERDAHDYKRRVRVTNVSDNITEDNLRSIFGMDDASVEWVFLPRDAKTGQNKGFAFITFKDSAMAEEAIKRHDYKFKNVVMHVSRALEIKS